MQSEEHCELAAGAPGTMTACFGKFWMKSIVSLLFCGHVYADVGNAVLLHLPHSSVYRYFLNQNYRVALPVLIRQKNSRDKGL